MATSAITNTLTDPSGTALADVVVVARLKPGNSFRTSDNSEVSTIKSTTTNGSGAWSLTLEENANIVPAGTYYEIEEQIPVSAGGAQVWRIQVGASDATLRASLLSTLPTDAISGNISQDTADARYVAVGGLPFVNVRDYGAVGNGTTDDTTAIQAALDNRGLVIVPPGSYAVSGLLIRPGTVLRGTSFRTTGTTPHSELKLISGSNQSIIATENTEEGFAGDANMHSIFIEHLALNGNKAGNTSGHGIWFVTPGFTGALRNLLVTQCAEDGIHLGGAGATNADRFSIENLGIASCDGSGLYVDGDSGYTVLNVTNLKVDNCHNGIEVSGGTGRRSGALIITGYRSEVFGVVASTVMEDSIRLAANGAYVVIIGAKFFRGATTTEQRAGAGVRIATSTARLVAIGLDQTLPDANTAYANLIQDDTSSMSVADGPLSFYVHPAAGENSAIFNRNLTLSTLSGDPGYRQFRHGEQSPRLQIQDGHLQWGSGSALDVSLSRSAANTLLLADGDNVAFGSTTGSKLGTSSTHKLGFYGATPVVQPAANADTSGATLGQLETEVNELKVTLRSLGLLAT